MAVVGAEVAVSAVSVVVVVAVSVAMATGRLLLQCGGNRNAEKCLRDFERRHVPPHRPPLRHKTREAFYPLWGIDRGQTNRR